MQRHAMLCHAMTSHSIPDRRTTLCTVYASLHYYYAERPEGRSGSSDVPPLSGMLGLSFDSIFLFAPFLFCLVLLLLLSSPFFRCWPSLLPAYFPEMPLNFFFFSRVRCVFVLPLFLVVLVFGGYEMIRWSVISVACYLMALVLDISLLDMYLF